MADRNELPIRQDGTGHGKPKAMEMEQSPLAAYDGDPVYAFLLSLLNESLKPLVDSLLRD